MTESNADLLTRVLAQIAAMRKNLPQRPLEPDADRFHEQLDRLDGAGYDVSEFRLDPERDMYRFLRTSNDLTGEKTYDPVRDVNPGVLESKMDAILSYFLLDQAKPTIGFAAPRKRSQT